MKSKTQTAASTGGFTRRRFMSKLAKGDKGLFEAVDGAYYATERRNGGANTLGV